MREERREEREESANVRVLNNSNSTDRVCTTGRGHDRKREERREKREERREKREEMPKKAARDPQMRPREVPNEVPRGHWAGGMAPKRVGP